MLLDYYDLSVLDPIVIAALVAAVTKIIVEILRPCVSQLGGCCGAGQGVVV